MPLLVREPTIYPDGLLEKHCENGARWWVLHTRPRAEKSVARKLLRARVGFFLPVYEKRWAGKTRQFRSHPPLFPGYVFAFGDQQACAAAQQTNLLVRVLPVPDQLQLQRDLIRVHRVMHCGQELTRHDALAPGKAVRIVSGPLAGLEGTVIRAGKRTTFFVDVRFLNRGVSVRIDGSLLEPRLA